MRGHKSLPRCSLLATCHAHSAAHSTVQTDTCHLLDLHTQVRGNKSGMLESKESKGHRKSSRNMADFLHGSLHVDQVMLAGCS